MVSGTGCGRIQVNHFKEARLIKKVHIKNGGRRLEQLIWDVIDPAEEFLRSIRRRWKHADHGGEQDAKKEEC